MRGTYPRRAPNNQELLVIRQNAKADAARAAALRSRAAVELTKTDPSKPIEERMTEAYAKAQESEP